jgi:ketosteroid isomerase-like protein
MKTMFALAISMIYLALCCVVAVQGQPKIDDLSQIEVRTLERAWLDAYEKKDVVAMTSIVADDFTITFPDGGIQTKQQIVESLKRPGGTVMKFKTENVQSRAYGNTVILIGIVVSEWTQNGRLMFDRSRYTDTYVRRNGKWQVVASHLSAATK